MIWIHLLGLKLIVVNLGETNESLHLAEAGSEALIEEAETIIEMTDSGQEDTETETSNYVIYEHKDENTLIWTMPLE